MIPIPTGTMIHCMAMDEFHELKRRKVYFSICPRTEPPVRYTSLLRTGKMWPASRVDVHRATGDNGR